ncbi:MAG: hypothetical protein ACLFWL_04975 [Candidatus Brocadiia bacterium]
MLFFQVFSWAIGVCCITAAALLKGKGFIERRTSQMDWLLHGARLELDFKDSSFQAKLKRGWHFVKFLFHRHVPFGQLYHPSLVWLIIFGFALGVGCLGILERLLPPKWELPTGSRLLAIKVAIGSAVFPMMLFVVGLSFRRTLYGLNLAEILLRQTLLLPHVLLLLLSLVPK